jgi:hypothetical protein
MLSALTYLALRSTWNRLSYQLRRLRSPRYLIAIILGLLYLYAIVEQQHAARGDESNPVAWVELAAALGALGVVIWAWLIGSERRALSFSPADVTFLFAGPVTRRNLIAYKLLRSQLTVLFTVVLWTVLLSRERFGASPWLRSLSLWVLLTTLSLHRLGASFVRSAFKEYGSMSLRRRVLPSLAAIVGIGIVAASLWRAAPDLTAAARNGGIEAIFGVLTAVAIQPPMAWVLVPFRIIVRPLTAPTPAAWLHTIGPAIAVLVAHAIWVIRSDAAFEEVAAEHSMARLRRRSPEQRARSARARSRRRALPKALRLQPVGWPAGGIVWKNIVSVVRARPIRALVITGLAAALGTALLSLGGSTPIAEIIGSLALIWTVVMFLVGPQWVRNDFRDDLPSFDLLRSYPVRSDSLVAAEVAGSTLVLTVVQLALLGFAYLAFLGSPGAPLTLTERTLALVAALVYLPPINYASMLIQNAGSILFPAWVRGGPERAGGVEALGQNMLLIVAHVGALAVVLAGPALAATAVYYLLRPVLGGWAELGRAVTGVSLLVVEASFIVRWLGGVLDRTDSAFGTGG